jgi:hypothetical protein
VTDGLFERDVLAILGIDEASPAFAGAAPRAAPRATMASTAMAARLRLPPIQWHWPRPALARRHVQAGAVAMAAMLGTVGTGWLVVNHPPSEWRIPLPDIRPPAPAPVEAPAPVVVARPAPPPVRPSAPAPEELAPEELAPEELAQNPAPIVAAPPRVDAPSRPAPPSPVAPAPQRVSAPTRAPVPERVAAETRRAAPSTRQPARVAAVSERRSTAPVRAAAAPARRSAPPVRVADSPARRPPSSRPSRSTRRAQTSQPAARSNAATPERVVAFAAVTPPPPASSPAPAPAPARAAADPSGDTVVRGTASTPLSPAQVRRRNLDALRALRRQ